MFQRISTPVSDPLDPSVPRGRQTWFRRCWNRLTGGLLGRSGHDEKPEGTAPADESFSPLRSRLRLCLSVPATLLLGGILSLIAFTMARTWEDHRLDTQFSDTAQDYVSTFARMIDVNLLLLHAPRSLLLASEEVTNEEFATFAQPLLYGDTAIRAWAWIPRVSRAERADYEKAARRDVSPDFEIREMDADRRLVRAGDRDEYFPVHFSASGRPSEAAYGFDLGSEATRRAALELACDTGRTTSSAAVPLISSFGHHTGFLVFLPMYDGPSDTPARRREHLRGFVCGVFFVHGMMEQALGHLHDRSLRAALFDRTDSKAPELLAVYSGQAAGVVSGPGAKDDQTLLEEPVASWLSSSLWHLAPDLRVTRDLDVAGRRWTIVCFPEPGFLAQSRSWYPWWILAGSLLLTGMIALLVKRGVQHTAAVERLVQERTHALRESEQKSRTIFDMVQVGIVLVNAETRLITDVNPAAAAMIGIDREKLVGKPCRNHICPATREACPVLIRGRVCNADCSLLTVANQSVPILKTAVLLTLGGRDYVLESFVDISSRLRAEEELNRRTLALESANQALRDAKHAAEAANEAKSQFLTNMSHELRTPLHGILSFAAFGVKNLAQRQCRQATVETGTGCEQTDRELQEYFQLIQKSGQMLLNLVNDLLDLAKLESGRMEFQFKPVDLEALVLAAVDELHPLAREHGLAIETRSTSDSLAFADAARLWQVLRNLLGNAIKFSPPGGHIEIELNGRDDGVEVRVLDQGPGIPEEELEAVFDKFVQSSKTRTGAGGTGLGLAICREILDAHHGRIWAENRPSGGAILTFLVPRPPLNATVSESRGLPISASDPLSVSSAFVPQA